MSSAGNDPRRGDILIVDDQPQNLAVLSGLLQSAGHHVRAVTSGDRALEAARLVPPDCVLLDISMPGMDGLATCRAFQSDAELARVPIIFLTAFDDPEHKVAAFKAGGRDYVSKPFQVEEVLARVDAQLALVQCERELRQRNAELVLAYAKLDELTRAEARTQESRFRALIEMSQDAIALTDRAQTFLYLSPAGQRMLGFDPAVGARHGFELWHPDDVALIEERRTWLLAHPGESARVEVRIRSASGEWRWYDLVTTNLLDDPSVGALVSNFRDITEGRRALDDLRGSEAALQQTQKLLRRAHEIAAIGAYVIDLRTKIIRISAETMSLLGAGSEAQTMPLDEYRRRFYYRADQAASVDAAESAYAGGGTLTLESRVVREDGAIIWVRTSSSVEPGDDGNPVVVGVVQDITEQRRVLDDLRASEARFRALTESGVVGIAIAVPTGAVIDANDTFLGMVGYSRDDLSRGLVSWRRMTPRELEQRSQEATDEVRARGYAKPWEKEYIRKDGTRVPCIVGVSAIDTTSNIMIVVDLTDQKRVEAALQRSETQLRQAQKMEAVGRLAGGVAHDFNNILSVVLSYSAFVRDSLGPDHPSAEDVAEIRAAGARAADLTRQLLLFSRQQVVETKVIDLNEVLGGMSKMVRRLLGEDVDLKSTVGSSLWRFRGDPGSVEQVIMNLVVNARDAMPHGGMLALETANAILDDDYALAHHGAVPGPYVMLSVTDTGSGMDEATQAQIFEPFFTTKEAGKGTGLGLSTVFGIMQQSGGTVWVESEPGKGATFKVYFPRVEDVAPSTTKATALRAPPGGRETILLVEDDEHVRTVARGILRRNGYEVLEACNGSDALSLCERHPATIHLLLSDVVMPKMSGPELARRVMRIHPETRVLCMSGYTDDASARHGSLDSGVAFMQKPFTPESLARKVREVFDGPARHLPE